MCKREGIDDICIEFPLNQWHNLYDNFTHCTARTAQPLQHFIPCTENVCHFSSSFMQHAPSAGKSSTRWKVLAPYQFPCGENHIDSQSLGDAEQVSFLSWGDVGFIHVTLLPLHLLNGDRTLLQASAFPRVSHCPSSWSSFRIRE